MCLLFPKRPFRAHDKSDVAAVDLHFTFQIAAKGTKIGRGIEALCVFIECPDIQRQAVKPFLFRLCLAKSEQRRPDTMPTIFFVYAEFFNGSLRSPSSRSSSPCRPTSHRTRPRASFAFWRSAWRWRQ